MKNKAVSTGNIIGYVVAGLGLIGILLSTETNKQLLPFLENVSSTIILIIAVILIAVGSGIMIYYGKEKSAKEVPIYKGK